MCGIAGFVDREPSPRQAREALLRTMCATIRHRGPDDEGIYVDHTAALGMRRLSIIDLSTGHQPMSNEEGTLWVVFNGEIYNYREVGVELKARGHRFRTSCDTEVIVHAWEEWGEDALSRLRGMFGLAIWDAASRTLWLARDRPGIKPLHYAVSGSGRLVFGSEIKALLADRSVDRTLDPSALDHYCSFLYTPCDRSIFAGVRKLPPAHCLRWRDGSVRVWRYWDLPAEETFRGTEADAALELRARLADAVKAHMVSDVPLGAFLSGGVDSSAVVGFMAEASSKPVRTFSVGFEEAAFDELDHARVVAKRFGTDHHEFVVRPDAVGLVDRLISHFDEPFADSSALPTWYVSQMASRHVTVVLSGDGGDELFGGYERYLPHPRVSAFDRLAGAARPLAAAAWPHWPRGWRGRNFLRHVSLGPEARYIDDLTFFRSDDKAVLYSPDLWSRLPGDDTSDTAAGWFEGGRHLPWAGQMMRLDFLTYLPEDVLTKVDRMSMAHSIESRVPLLDTAVVEFAASLPSTMRISDGRLKRVFKAALAGLLPAEVLHRPKHGFGVPLGTWFGGHLRELFADTLLSSRARSRGLFQQQAVERLLQEHLSARRDHTLRIWILVVLELWHRQYVDHAAAATAA